jgi:hypothetical protein
MVIWDVGKILLVLGLIFLHLQHYQDLASHINYHFLILFFCFQFQKTLGQSKDSIISRLYIYIYIYIILILKSFIVN